MAKGNNRQIFKEWVPTWLIYATMFVFLLPLAAVLGMYLGSANVAASYYGVDTSDIQFSTVVYYIAIASIFPLEARYFNFFSSKRYLIACVGLFIIINAIVYFCRNFAVLVVIRYIGGAISHGAIGIMFTLVFKQFHEQRSRILGYATMYGILFGSAPLTNILNAYLFEHYNFNSLFAFKMFSVIPGTLLMCIILKNNIDLRRNKVTPSIKDIDVISFVLYTTGLLSLAYFFLYGQYYQWLDSFRIQLTLSLAIACITLFILRQLILKNPYIDLRVYRTRNFRIGMLLLVVFYLAKGDMGMLASFLYGSVHLDTYNYGYVMMMNAIGIVGGSLLGARYILAGMRIRIIWMMGFGSLLAYHLLCISIINYQAEIIDLLFPLFLQGFGNGILIISIVIFYVTAVPPEIGFSASVSGVAVRATTFTASMGITSFFGLYFGKIHNLSFSNHITSANAITNGRIMQYQQAFNHGGASHSAGSSGAMQLLGQTIHNQNTLLAIKDYYWYMSYLMILVLLLIVTIPHFSYQIKKIKARFIPV